MWSFPVSWNSGSSDRLGYKASDPADVIKFLNNPDGKCFLFPDTHMGPDLSCFFQDVVTKELIFLSLQSKLSKKLSAEASLRALESVNSDFFYNVEVCSGGLSTLAHPLILYYRRTATEWFMPRQGIPVLPTTSWLL
jgi:hypothetical protein